MTPTIFIDGDAGTTGLQIRERLAGRSDVDLVALPDAQRIVEAVIQGRAMEVDRWTNLLLPARSVLQDSIRDAFSDGESLDAARQEQLASFATGLWKDEPEELCHIHHGETPLDLL